MAIVIWNKQDVSTHLGCYLSALPRPDSLGECETDVKVRVSKE